MVAVQIFASRYGPALPPAEDFHVYLIGADRKVIKDLAFPYGKIERTTQMQWYTLPVPEVEVPEQFLVALSFNPGRTKGIYLCLDKSVEQTHSYTGLPEAGFAKLTDNEDWMVRVCLSSGE